LERSNNIKNEEKILATKKHTYDFNGDIIFVKKANYDSFPQTVCQPKFGTKKNPIHSRPENTIHQIYNSRMSQEEIIQQHFKKPATVLPVHRVRPSD